MPDKIIVLNMRLSPWQQRVNASRARFKFVRAGKRTGKTKFGHKWLLDGIMDCQRPDDQVVYIAPTKVMARDISWTSLKGFIPREIIANISEQRLEISFRGGHGMLALRGSDDFDALRGKPYRRAWLDEAAFHKPEGWDIVRSQLMDYHAPALFTTTPNGSNWYRREEDLAKSKSDSEVFHFTAYDNPFIDPKELDSIKADLIAQGKKEVWEQEYLAEYVDKVGQVYWEFQQEASVVTPETPIRARFTVRGMDWGMEDYTACAFIDVLENGAVYVRDEYIANNMSVAQHVEAIREKSAGKLIQSTIIDSSTFNRESDMSSVAKRFAALGIHAIKATKDFDTSVSAMKELFANHKIMISSKCGGLLAAIRDWNWDSHEPDILAATRYGIYYLIQSGYVKVDRVIQVQPAKTVPQLIQERIELAKAQKGLNFNFGNEGKAFKIMRRPRLFDTGY